MAAAKYISSKDAPALDEKPTIAVSLPKYQAKYKFVNIAPINSKMDDLGVYKPIHVPHARVFEIEKFFSEQECDYYLQQAEKEGFEALATEYPPEYRNNERCVII